MKETIKLCLVFLAFFSLICLPWAYQGALSDYKSYKNVEEYYKIKVKLDSSHFGRYNHKDKGGYYNLFYSNGVKLKLRNTEYHLLVISEDQQRFAEFEKIKRDSIYLWVNKKAKTIYALNNEKALNENLLRKQFYISLSAFVFQLLLITPVILMYIKNRKKEKGNNTTTNNSE